jgi:hypothetical protein
MPRARSIIIRSSVGQKKAPMPKRRGQGPALPVLPAPNLISYAGAPAIRTEGQKGPLYVIRRAQRIPRGKKSPDLGEIRGEGHCRLSAATIRQGGADRNLLRRGSDTAARQLSELPRCKSGS